MTKGKPIFVVQEHHARTLHGDFRLEIDGVLKSWAVPKGPSLDPEQRRLAIQVPDHDMEHGDYEGIIPPGTYGAGPVLIWDKGCFETIDGDAPIQSLEKGNLRFELHGEILKGAFALVKLHGPSREKAWLLIKKQDSHAQRGWKTPVMLTLGRRRTLAEQMPACAVSEM